jgi:phosphatidylglycerol---prolipoprotein diacylglyceryl transferase
MDELLARLEKFRCRVREALRLLQQREPCLAALDTVSARAVCTLQPRRCHSACLDRLLPLPVGAPMIVLAIPFPDIDPVALHLGPLAVKWYGLAYMAGLLLGWLYVRRLLSQDRLWPDNAPPFSPDRADDLLLFMTLGVLVGGRLGNVLFYEPVYYFHNPLEIPAVWKGGMAFHGGLIGSIVAILWFARRAGANPWSVLDVCAAATPMGLFFGRLANFINAELWGRPSSMPWAMIFPGAGSMPRHPSQLYEAGLEGLALFLLLWWLAHSRLALRRPGVVAGTFLVGYGFARSFCELFREPDFLLGPLSAGMLYSLPMMLVGVWMIRRGNSRTAASANVPRSG